jgi:eukaryotic-like serine/threonine-protein kinase
LIGRTLSHYVLEAPLGKGGMGEVYGARDSRLGRSVAIKILPAAAASPESIQRFMTEAKAASALNHPNIVTVHDVDHADGLHFIVMEKIDGGALSTLAGSPMAVERFVDIALQVTSALAAAHAVGIVHRDIKPANIMLTPSGSVKVVDFGLARLIAPEAPVSGEEATAQWVEQATRPGAVLGTLGYMSPEQLEGRRADARSDVFSLGVVFYALLTGRPAFAISSPLVTVASILRDDPPRVDAVRGDVPKALADLVEKCLEKNPAARFADAAEVHVWAPYRRRRAGGDEGGAGPPPPC